MSGASPIAPQFFVPGGTMKPDADSYVFRKADDDLLSATLAREFCYVLTARQMGKSSLMTRTALKLAQTGVRSAQVDLTLVGADKSSITAEQWYYGVAYRILRELRIPAALDAWWKERSLLPPVQKLTEFLRDMVLENCPANIVIFVDEIDSTIGLPFSDDFFAAIRACYNARAKSSPFERLTFVLLGVATPAELIIDPTRTPFNVGRAVQLADFTREEALPLAAGLHGNPELASKMLQRVLYWTGGHPYLTQTLCWHMVRNTTLEVDELVQHLFLSKQAPALEDANLRLVRERLTHPGSDLADVLQAYLRVVAGQSVRDDPTSSVHASLRLAGVVKTDQAGELTVRNRIYKRVFSESWVRSHMPSEPDSIRGLDRDVAEAYVVYDALRKSPRFRSEAASNLALFWEHRGSRDEAILTRINGLKDDDKPVARRWIRSLLEPDYPYLLASYVHSGVVAAAVLSPDGSRVLTGSSDKSARLWSAESGERLFHLQQRAGIRVVAFSASGDLLATGCDDNTARVWSAVTGQLRGRPLEHEASIRCVDFHPTGDRLLTTSADGTAVIWNLESGDRACPPLEHEFSVLLGLFSPDGETIVTSGPHNSAYLWRASTGERIGVFPHEEEITAFAFHPDSRVVVTASEDGTARLWSTDSGLPVLGALVHKSSVTSAAFSPDGKLVVTGSADKAARIWRADSGELACAPMWHRGHVLAVAFSTDGERIATGDGDGAARLWFSETGEPASVAFRHGSRVTSVSFSRNGDRLLTCGKDDSARLWRADRQMGSRPPASAGRRNQRKPRAERIRLPYGAHTGEIVTAGISGDGVHLMTGSIDGSAKVWLAASGEPASPSLLHPDSVRAGEFSTDGSALATGCDDGVVRLWTVESGKLLLSLTRHRGPIVALAFSPDGVSLATANSDTTVQLWNLATGEAAVPELKHRDPVRILAFSPDGSMLITGGHDRNARLWSVASGEFLGALTHSSSVIAAAWTPDGEGVLTATTDRTMRLWRLNKASIDDSSVAFTLQSPDVIEDLAVISHDRFLAATRQWLYCYPLAESPPVLLSARLLAGRWSGAFRHCVQSDSLDAALLDTGNDVLVVTLKLSSPEVSQIDGDPEYLLFEWQRRLGLFMNEEARISPEYS